MAYLFTARAVPGSHHGRLHEGYTELEGSCTLSRFGDGPFEFGRPTRIRWNGPARPIPDVVKMPYLCVSQRARDLIERFDSGVHRFFPVGRDLDSVSREHSQMLRSGDLWFNPGGERAHYMFDRNAIGGAHMWRDLAIIDNPILVSSTMAAAIARHSLPGIQFRGFAMR